MSRAAHVATCVAAAFVVASGGACGPALEGSTLTVPTGGAQAIDVNWRRLLTEPPILEYKPQEFAAAASDGQRVFVGSSQPIFHALGALGGQDLWKVAMPGGVSSRPLYVAETDTVLVGSDDGVLYALTASTGKQRWSYKTKGSITSAPVYDDGLVYFTNGENRLYALDGQTGAWRWQYERELPESFTVRGSGGPLLVNGRAYVGFADGYLVALGGRTGDVVWSRSLAGEAVRFTDVDSTPVLVGGMLYASSYSGGVYGVDPASGAIRWHFAVEGAGTVVASGEHLWFAAARNGVHCLDNLGRLVWRQALAAQGELSTPVLVAGNLLVVSASLGGMYAVDAASGRLLQFFSAGHGVTAQPISDGKQIYVLTNTGFLYAFRLLAGRG